MCESLADSNSERETEHFTVVHGMLACVWIDRRRASKEAVPAQSGSKRATTLAGTIEARITLEALMLTLGGLGSLGSGYKSGRDALRSYLELADPHASLRPPNQRRVASGLASK